MKYSRFKGTIYVSDGQASDRAYHFSVIADGKTIYTSPEIRRNSAPIQLDLNITGCNDFIIKSSGYNYSHNDMCINIGNGGFYQ